MAGIQEVVDIRARPFAWEVAAVLIVDVRMRFEERCERFFHAVIRAVVADENLDVRIILRERALERLAAEARLVVRGDHDADERIEHVRVARGERPPRPFEHGIVHLPEIRRRPRRDARPLIFGRVRHACLVALTRERANMRRREEDVVDRLVPRHIDARHDDRAIERLHARGEAARHAHDVLHRVRLPVLPDGMAVRPARLAKIAAERQRRSEEPHHARPLVAVEHPVRKDQHLWVHLRDLWADVDLVARAAPPHRRVAGGRSALPDDLDDFRRGWPVAIPRNLERRYHPRHPFGIRVIPCAKDDGIAFLFHGSPFRRTLKNAPHPSEKYDILSLAPIIVR